MKGSQFHKQLVLNISRKESLHAHLHATQNRKNLKIIKIKTWLKINLKKKRFKSYVKGVTHDYNVNFTEAVKSELKHGLKHKSTGTYAITKKQVEN